MFLGCRGEANRPITLPSNWQSPVINVTLISVYVSSSPLLSLCHSFSPILWYTSGYLLSPVCLRHCLLNNGQTVEKRVRWRDGKTKEKI